MTKILVDTSSWIENFREPDPVIAMAIQRDLLWVHEFVIAELALGSIPDRKRFLADLNAFARSPAQSTIDLISFIEEKELSSVGIGYVDAHLLMSAQNGQALLWTRDKRLQAQAERLGLAYLPE